MGSGIALNSMEGLDGVLCFWVAVALEQNWETNEECGKYIYPALIFVYTPL